MAAPTKAELEAVQQFRMQNFDIKELADYSDLKCVTWLRARDLNVSKASEMLIEHLVWRKEVDVDNIMAYHPPKHFLKDYIFDIPGTDREGHPVIICPIGEWDFVKTVNMGESKDFVRFITQVLEKIVSEMKYSSKKIGKEMTQFSLILDFEKFSLRQITSAAAIHLYLQLVRSFEANYPETLFSVYIINAPRAFYILFSIIKPLLSARTVGKINIYTTPDKWKPVLLEDIPLSILPDKYKGVCIARRFTSFF